MFESVCELVWLRRKDQQMEARLSALIDDHVDQVWAALTQPDRLPLWLAPGQIEPRVGGAVKLDFAESGVVIDSRVTALQPQHLLEYSWSGPGEPERPLRWEIEPVGPMAGLTLTIIQPATEDIARACAGWAAHIDMLVAALAGIPIKFPFDTFKTAREIYRDRLAAV
jgi:uncharacterized protein YndB with AHSA1/START domain